ncbi:MAG: WbqC family protein [Candidatus Cyclobacteriaceae bacterium M3_2C_046]
MKNNSALLIELQYLPPIAYFSSWGSFNTIIIEKQEYFEKQSYRNRCYIRGANKVQTLSVPVYGSRKKILTRDIRIDYQQKWVNEHWRSISSAYGKSPFFEHFADLFHRIYHKRPAFLFDLNWFMLSLCLEILGWKKNIKFSEQYEKNPKSPIKDLRSAIHPKKSIETFSFYKTFPYNQIFGVKFEANLSIIDLIFCEGLNTNDIIHNSMDTP